jgi:aminopeptidase N
MKTYLLILATIFSVSPLFSQLNTPFEKAWFEDNKTLKQPKYNSEMDKYDVKFYFLNLNVTNTSKNISGSGSILATVLVNNFSSLVVELHSSLTVDSVKVDNVIHTYTRSGNEITIPLTTTLNSGDDFYITVFYRGSSTGTGIKNQLSPSWQRQVTYTLSESYHSLDWFPCKQSLTDKADSCWVFLTVNNNLKAGSNGLLTQIVPDGTTKSRYEWKSNYPIDYYLISLSVSDYQEYNIYAHPQGISDSVLIQNYIYPNANYLSQYQTMIDMTAGFIEFLSDIWGIYPFHAEKYGHCTAPFSGGMEHQTMTSLGYFTFELVIHELAHQWFGDYVTCATWQDIWVNEGFATYSNYLGLEHFNSHAEAQNYMAGMHTDIKSQPDGSIYVPFSQVMDEARIFSYRLTYQKGAAILHTLRFMVDNDSIYFAAFRDFLQTYAFGTAYADDFRDIMESHTGLDLHPFFDQWFYGEGFPTYSIETLPLNDTVYCTLTQTPSAPAITPFFSNPLEIKFFHATGDTVIRIQPTSASYSFQFYFPQYINFIEIDPENDIVNNSGSVIINKEYSTIKPTTVYPNPSSGFVYIISENSYDTYIISDLNGKTIASGSVLSNTIPFNEAVAGIYHLTLQGKSTMFNTRIVVIK